MSLLLFGAIAAAALHDYKEGRLNSNDKKKKEKKKERVNYSRRESRSSRRRDDSWLDAAWFHDHNQCL